MAQIEWPICSVTFRGESSYKRLGGRSVLWGQRMMRNTILRALILAGTLGVSMTLVQLRIPRSALRAALCLLLLGLLFAIWRIHDPPENDETNAARDASDGDSAHNNPV